MAELVVREIDTELVDKLKQRAEQHQRSVEEEHRAILHDVLLGEVRDVPAISFETYLKQMPDVGKDADFSRIEGSFRDANLAD